MKKNLPYLLIAGVVLATILLTIGNKKASKRDLDLRVTFRKTDRIPYGTYVAYHHLSHIFPMASVVSERSAPGSWDNINQYLGNQALIIISRRFLATTQETEDLVEFARKGNYVFISSPELSVSAQDVFNMRSSVSFGSFEAGEGLEVKLRKPPFAGSGRYKYPGFRFDSYLFRFDSLITNILGTSFDDEPNLVRFNVGKGSIFIHLAPMCFSNYFLLHRANMDYYNRVLSQIPVSVNKVVWDEYYLNKTFVDGGPVKKGWLGVMMEYPPLKWGLLTGLFTFIAFVLFEMRRKQRPIPIIPAPRNESLDFIRTIGRLYFDRQDHQNLGKKLAAHFLEQVRSRYRISTSELDEQFIERLHAKSGYPAEGIKEIVATIRQVDRTSVLSEEELIEFYKKLESFYKHT